MIQQRPFGVARIFGQVLQQTGTDLGARGLLIGEDVEDDVHDLPAEFRIAKLDVSKLPRRGCFPFLWNCFLRSWGLVQLANPHAH